MPGYQHEAGAGHPPSCSQSYDQVYLYILLIVIVQSFLMFVFPDEGPKYWNVVHLNKLFSKYQRGCGIFLLSPVWTFSLTHLSINFWRCALASLVNVDFIDWNGANILCVFIVCVCVCVCVCTRVCESDGSHLLLCGIELKRWVRST